MAKISANRAVEVARFRNEVRGEMLVRSDGTLLGKSGVPGDGWHVVQQARFTRGATPEDKVQVLLRALRASGLREVRS